MCITNHTSIIASCEDNQCLINGLQAQNQTLKNQIEWFGGSLKSWADRFKAIETELQKYADAGDLDLDNNVLHQYLADEFMLTFTEEHDIEITIRITARVEMPVGYELGTTDFYFEDGELASSTEDVVLLSQDDPHISDLDINS